MKRKFLVLLTLITTLANAQQKINENWADWANFKKYADQNKSVPQKAKGERRVVFLGNSIFEGWLRSRPEFFAGKPYYDRGISGQTTPQMLLRFYDDVLALNPDVLVLKCGINDIAQNTGPYDQQKTINNIKAIAQLARANKIKVILCSVLPASDFKWRPGLEPADKVIALNAAIQQFAKEQDYYYLDLYSSVVDENKGMKKEYASDGVHPTVEGYKVLEPLVEAAILKVKK
ncbi:MAG: GDSL-type esterase/lipase family protein [Chitinophagaceae bacterium]